MSADGTRQRELTRAGGAEQFVGGPAWSADGRRIAYSVFALAVMNADGSGRHAIEDLLEANESADPSWAPDGARIAFSSAREGERDIWSIPSTGGAPTRLTAHGGKLLDDANPSWSPDGSRIAFARGAYSRRTGGYAHDLYVMKPDGTELVNLTRSAADEVQPDWSPDGRSLVFVRRGRFGGELWTAKADGTGGRKLTKGRVSDLDPAWSPDGKRIAFARGLPGHFAIELAGKFDVYVMRVDGTGVRRLTKNPDIDAAPAWQPLPH